MSSKIPTVRQIARISIIPQLLIIGLFFLIYYQFDKSKIYNFWSNYLSDNSQVLRRTIAKEHTKSMTKVKEEEFNEAITPFENSYQYFKTNDWIDKYRFLTLLSSAKMSYKEMALNNIVFCYGQIGNGKMSKEYYQKKHLMNF